MKPLYFFIVLSLLVNLSFAQIDLRNGTVYTNSGDTLIGAIQFRGDIKNSQECVFFKSNDISQTFSPFDIKGYQFENGRYYVSRKVNGHISKTVFAEFLVDGEKDLFYFRDKEGSHYLVSESDSTLIEIPLQTKQIKKNNKQYYVPPTKHIGFLKHYFQETPKIYDQIDQIKSPDRKDLIKLTKNYHELVCGNDNECIEYRKGKYAFSVALQPYFGYISFSPKKFETHYGALAHFWLPIANENLYFRTGYLLSEFGDGSRLSKIPLQLEYVFPLKIFKPKLGFGMNLFQGTVEDGYVQLATGSMVATGGFLIELNKSIFLDFTATFENPGLPRIDEPNNRIYSFGTGVWLKF